MFIYCICTIIEAVIKAKGALITASIRRGMEVINLWHCWGGMEAQVSLTVAFSSSAFFGLVSHFPLDNSSGLVSLLASQAHHHHGHLTNFCCFWQCEQVPNPCWKMKSASLKSWSAERKHEVLQNVLVNGCSDVGFQKTQWNQHQQMTLHPKSSQTV